MTPRDAMNNPLFVGDLVVLLWGNVHLRAVVYSIENGGKVTFFLMPHIEFVDPTNAQLLNVYKVVKPPDFQTPPLPSSA
jgi:hypothetical protein